MDELLRREEEDVTDELLLPLWLDVLYDDKLGAEGPLSELVPEEPPPPEDPPPPPPDDRPPDDLLLLDPPLPPDDELRLELWLMII